MYASVYLVKSRRWRYDACARRQRPWRSKTSSDFFDQRLIEIMRHARVLYSWRIGFKKKKLHNKSNKQILTISQRLVGVMRPVLSEVEKFSDPFHRSRTTYLSNYEDRRIIKNIEIVRRCIKGIRTVNVIIYFIAKFGTVINLEIHIAKVVLKKFGICYLDIDYKIY